MKPQAPEETHLSRQLIEQQRPRVPREAVAAMPGDLHHEWQVHFQSSPPRFFTWSRIAIATAGLAAVLALSFILHDSSPEITNDPLQEALLSYQEPDEVVSPLQRELLHYHIEP